jgi:hypothetical protein
MATKPLNPFSKIGTQFTNGMVDIEAGVLSGMTISDLNLLIYTYVVSLYFPSVNEFDKDQLNSILPVANNSYLSNDLENYTDVQSEIITSMKGQILSSPITSIPDIILDYEENIIKSGLSWETQAPLLLATEIGKTGYEYWLNAVNNASSNWYLEGFFNANAYVNYANIPHFVNAGVWGALGVGNLAKEYGLIDPPRIIGVDVLSALIGALSVTSGKVIFNWTPTSQKIISNLIELNEVSISRINISRTEESTSYQKPKPFTRSCIRTCRAPDCCPRPK